MRLRYGKIAAGPLFWVVLCFQMCAAGVMARPAFTLLDSAQQGVFNIGNAAGRCDRVRNPAFGRTVLQFNYTVPRGTSAGIWARGFPQRAGSGAPDMLRLRVIVPGTAAPENVTATVELKGAKATQQIPLCLEAGENSMPVLIECPRIGSLNEFVLAISQAGGDQPVTGTLLLDCEFQTRTPSQKAQTTLAGRIGSVVFFGGLLAFVALIGNRLCKLRARSGRVGGIRSEHTNLQWQAIQDLCHGSIIVLIAVAVLGVYVLGRMSPLETGWNYLCPVVVGVFAASVLKCILTGRAPTPGEAFRDFLFTGVLAASAHNVRVWQVTDNLSELVRLSPLGATVFCALYHAANAYALVNLKNTWARSKARRLRSRLSRWACRWRFNPARWCVHWEME